MIPIFTDSNEVEVFVHLCVVRYVPNIGSIESNLVGKHAGCGYLNGIWPVEVVVAEGVGEVKNGVLGHSGGVLSHVEVGRLHCSLGDRVGHQVEVELAIDHLLLLNETSVYVSALWRV